MAVDYKQKAVEYLATDLASYDTGIYAKSINGKQRTEWEEGWNACTMDITKRSTLIAGYLKDLPDEVIDCLMEDKIGIYVRDEEIKLYVNCNDLFYWACADSEDFELADLDDFKQAYKDSPGNGNLLWCCRKRKMRPQKPFYRYFDESDAELFNACGPERDE